MNVAQAKQLHLKDVLSRLGYEAQREDKGEHWYLSPFREEQDASFKITRDGKGWYDHGAGHGGNILDFVIRYYHLPDNGIQKALQKLDRLLGTSSSQTDLYVPTKPSEAVFEPVRTDSDIASPIQVETISPLRRRTLIRYLTGRGIPVKLARPYVQQIDYHYGGQSYFALAFASDSGGYELRNAHFKGCYQKKDITTLRINGSDGVAVFEGFMDFLTAIAYTGRPPRQHVIVMNSGSMRERAVAAIQGLAVRQVHLYLDHDPSGRDLTRYFTESLPGCEVVDGSGLYAGYKDWNDFWIARQSQSGA